MKILGKTIEFPLLNPFLGIEKMGRQALKEVNDIFIRSDTPKGEWVCPDLQDQQTNFMNTPSGYRISGLLHIEDVNKGSDSPAFFLLLSILAFVFFAISMVAQTFFGASLATVLTTSGGAIFIGSIGYALYSKNFMTAAKIALLGAAFALYGLISQLLSTYLQINAALVGQIMFASVAAIPLLVTRSQRLQRARELKIQSRNYTGEDNYSSSVKSLETRLNQAKQAYVDQESGSSFIFLGRYIGTMGSVYSPYVPDPGQIAGYSEKDAQMHTYLFGASGTGKTSLLRTYVKAFAEMKTRQGMFILDGKGVFPNEARKLLDYVLDHKAKYNPIQGLKSEEIAAHMFAPHMKAGDHNAIFKQGGKDILRHVAEFLEHITQHNIISTLFFNIDGLLALTNMCKDKTKRKDIVTIMHAHNQINPDQYLTDSIVFMQDLDSKPDDLLMSFFTNVDIVLGEFYSSRDLKHWCSCVNSDIEIKDVFLQTARIGVAVGDNYQQAGIANLRLIKRQFYSRLAASERLKEKTNRFLFMMDEAPILLNFSDDGFGDDAMVAVIRSRGGDCLFAGQNMNQIIAMSSESRAVGFLANFSSSIYFKPNDPRTFKHAQFLLGKAPRNQLSGVAGKTINYRDTIQNLARSSENDPEHPLRDVMRALGSEITLRKEKLQSQSALIINAAMTPDSIKDVLTEAEFTKYLAQSGVALGIFERAGGKRFDFMRVNGLDSNFQPYNTEKKFNEFIEAAAAREAQLYKTDEQELAKFVAENKAQKQVAVEA